MSVVDQVPVNSGFSAKSTAAEVMSGFDMTGKVAVVTGGYSGIGLEVVRALADAGARVIVPVRSPEKVAEAHDRLDLLINNAGIMACPLAHVGPGWESQIRHQSYGPFRTDQGALAADDSNAGYAGGGTVFHRAQDLGCALGRYRL